MTLIPTTAINCSIYAWATYFIWMCWLGVLMLFLVFWAWIMKLIEFTVSCSFSCLTFSPLSKTFQGVQLGRLLRNHFLLAFCWHAHNLVERIVFASCFFWMLLDHSKSKLVPWQNGVCEISMDQPIIIIWNWFFLPICIFAIIRRVTIFFQLIEPYKSLFSVYFILYILIENVLKTLYFFDSVF